MHTATPGARGAGFPFSPTATAILSAEALWHSLCSSALTGLAVQHTLRLAKVGIILNLYWKHAGLDAAFQKVLNFHLLPVYEMFSLVLKIRQNNYRGNGRASPKPDKSTTDLV